MKRLIVVVLVLFGGLLVGYTQPIPPSLNGWEFAGVEQGAIDTTFTRVFPAGGFQQGNCQGFVYKTVGNQLTVLCWKKDFSQSYPTPTWVRFGLRLNGSGPSPNNVARFQFYFKSGDSLYRMGNGPEWIQVSHGNTTWVDIPWRMELVTASHITGMVIKFSFLAQMPDFGEWAFTTLKALYGPSPWNPTSTVVIEPFGNVASVREIPGTKPEMVSLAQNYPNPFNPATKIQFQVVGSKFVSLRIYNLIGQEVATLVNEELRPGSYEATWDAVGMPSGTYIYRLSTSGFVETRKMVLLK
ncbi:MAG: T9SS type A sorting domain-containing protein [bacterium]|nr:T9SS type A sorting domain-containing protein [bacterium]